MKKREAVEEDGSERKRREGWEISSNETEGKKKLKSWLNKKMWLKTRKRAGV